MDLVADSNSCEFVEGCVAGVGARQVLRFTTVTPNTGAADLVIGVPAECDLLFHLSECHGHYHLEDFAAYRLWSKRGYRHWKRARDGALPANAATNAVLLANAAAAGELVVGRKQGFCMVDSIPVWPGVARQFVDCVTNQGISAGWADSYPASFDCQYLDVTGRAPGRYVLEVVVNPIWVLPESDFGNNVAAVRTRLRRLP
jgi:hypothetical protein